jgi:hypothetical protein
MFVSVYPPLLGNGKNPSTVARQRLGRNVTAVTNTHATIEELLEASFSMWPVSYQGKQAISSSQNFLVYLSFYLKTLMLRLTLVELYLHVPVYPHVVMLN